MGPASGHGNDVTVAWVGYLDLKLPNYSPSRGPLALHPPRSRWVPLSRATPVSLDIVTANFFFLIFYF